MPTFLNLSESYSNAFFIFFSFSIRHWTHIHKNPKVPILLLQVSCITLHTSRPKILPSQEDGMIMVLRVIGV